MSYTAEISRVNPTCFFFLIDQSASMLDPIMGVPGNPSKAGFVADALNRVIQSLAITANKEDQVRKYYQVGGIGYGYEMENLFATKFEGRDLIWIDEIIANPTRIESRIKKESDGVGGVIDVKSEFPVWIEAKGNGGTPMCTAFKMTADILSDWIKDHPSAYPPTVINFTDGEANDDGNPIQLAQELKKLRTADGEVLVFTLHVSSNQYAQTIVCPQHEEPLPDNPSKQMFAMSSEMTDAMIQMAANDFNTNLPKGSRAFVYNAGIEQLVTLLDIGTRPSNMR